MEDEDTVTTLLTLLEDSPDPHKFCFHKAMQGSEHQCTPQQTSSMPQTNTVLVDSTPIQLKKVLSPHNLELDSDTSSVAAWSFSMATPTTVPQGGADKAGGNCSHINLSLISTTTTTADEDSPEDEEGISSADESVLRLMGKQKSDHYKTLLKIKDKVLIKNKSVARALFPAKGDDPDKASPLKSQQQTPAAVSKCSSFDPCRLFSPIPSIVSPLVHHHQHAKTTDTKTTPLKEVSDQSVASVSLFETPGKGGVRDVDNTTSCSQELFGSPEIFTPAQIPQQSERDTHIDDHLPEAETSPHIIERTSHTYEQQPFNEEVTNIQQNQHGKAIANLEQQTPLLVKRFSSEPHLLPHSTPLSSLTQPGPSHTFLSHSAFPYSSTQPQTSVPASPLNTPLCSTAQPRSSYQPSQVADQTPKVPLMVAKEPSPATHSEQSLASESDTVQVTSMTPVHEKKLNEQNYSFGSVGDVMDMLFMSSSQLDVHLSAHRVAIECPSATEPTKPIVDELDTKQTLSCPQSSPSDFGKCKTDEAVLKQKVDGVSLATTDTEDELKSGCVNVDVKMTTNESSILGFNTEDPAKVTRKGILSKAKAFHYPTKQRNNLKRKKSKIRTREYDIPQRSPEKITATKIEVEEPLAKRPRIQCDSNHVSAPVNHGDQTSNHKEMIDNVTKVDESMIEIDHTSKEKSPPHEMDIDITEKNMCFQEYQEERPIHSICSTNTLIEQSQKQLKDVQVTEEESNGPLSSETPTMACIPTRAPGLRRTNKKSKAPVASYLYPSPKEPGYEAKAPDTTESVSETMEAMQCPSAVDPLSKKQLVDMFVAKESSSNNPKMQSFIGFQTAAGTSITVSELALKRAHQLIGPELELEESSSTESPKTPKLTPPVVHLSTSTSASTTSPSVILNQTKEPNLIPTIVPSYIASPVLTGSDGQPSPATFPRRPNQCPTKSFKAPRKASDVSNAEEQASVARILRSFRASGVATEPPKLKSTRSRICRQPIETGFQTAGGSRLTVSSEAMEKAQKLVAEDKENGISSDTGSPILNSNRRKQHLVTGFKTAGGSRLTVSCEAMEKAEKLVTENRTNEISTDAGSPLLNSNRHKEQLVTGFKTAGGSTLTVSSEALERAQKLVTEGKENGIAADVGSPLLNPRKEEVVTGFKTASGKGLSASASSMAQAAIKFEEASTPNHTAHENAITVGFQMASGKSLSVSAKSMLKAESLLSFDLELDAETKADSRDFVSTGFQTAGGRDISVSSKSLKCAKKIVEEEEDKSQHFDDIKTSLFQSPLRNLQEETRDNAAVVTGFNTARGSAISVSRTSMQECEKLIEAGEHETSVNFHNCTVESGGSPCSLTAEDVETFGAFTQIDFQRQDLKSPNRNDLSPRSTIDNVQARADSDTHSDEQCDTKDGDKEGVNENEDHDCFFSTQVVKQLTDFSSEEEMSCGEENDTAVATDNKYASNNVNTVDDNSDGPGGDGLMEAQCDEVVHGHVESQGEHSEVEHADDALSREENDSVIAEHTDGGEMTDLLSESLALREFHEADTHQQGADESTLKVNLSGELTESMIENMEISINVSDLQPKGQEQVTTTEICVVSATSGSDRTSSQTGPEMSHVEAPVQDQPPPPPPGPSQPLSTMSQFPGLQTASGKEVHISENALKLAKQVLGLSSSDPVPPPMRQEKPTCSSLLQTASGKSVHVSESSLKAVRGILSDDGEARSTLTSHGPLERRFEHHGIQTASGKKVEVSESALLAVKAVLGSSNDNGRTSDTVNAAAALQPFPVGFTTAGGHKVQVSDEALAAVRSSSGNASMNIYLPTASGKKVEISEESTRAAKLLLDSNPIASSSGCSSSTGSGFPGLYTASGTKVTVSQKALEAARAILDDKTAPTRIPSHNRSFPGFTTAGGSKVTISEDSLQAARAVLGSTSTSNDHCHDVQTSVSVQSAPRIDNLTLISYKSQPSTCIAPPITTQPSSLPGAPTRKYKPIFRSGGAKSGRRPASFSSRVCDVTTNPLISVDTGVQQQLPTQSRATATGVLSTPEGTLYDRRQPPGRRPLLPKQSHLDGDGAYAMRNMAINPGRSSASLSSSSWMRSQSAQSHHKTSSMIFKTPHRNMAASSQSHFQSPSFSQSSGPSYQGSSVPSRSLLTIPRRTVAPPPSYYQRSSYSNHRPVWRGAVHASERGLSTSSSVTPTVSKPISQHSRQASGSHSYSSTVAKSTKMGCVVNQSLKQSPLTSNCVQTSTQLTEIGDKSTFDAPLSPLQITLSQICAMEDSQVLGSEEDTTDMTSIAIELTYEVSTAKSSTAAASIEDSGYASREVSTFQTPSPHSKDKVDPSHSVEKKPERNTKIEEGGICGTIDEDTLLAEAELEGLNDSLEELDNEDRVVIPASQKQLDEQAPDLQRSVKRKSPPSICQKASTSTHCSGVVKPQMGSLLSTRLNNTRVHLEHAVGYRPPGGFTLSQLHSLVVSEDTLLVRASNSTDFSFSGAQYFSNTVLSGSPACIGDGAMLKLSSNGRAGVLEYWEAFRALSCVDEKLISYKWFVNHYRQLVWKLASMEVCYPHLFGGRCLTPDWLMLQLKYRYDREIDQAERSALHKICENDDVPSRRMVLCVSQVYREKLIAASSRAVGENVAAKGTTDMESGNETVIQSETTKESKSDVTNANPPCIEVTDGWYSLPCALDPPLKQMIKRGKITVGTKLLIYGAELIGQSNPAHPLETPPGCHFRISANSTRRARWFTKLGYQPMPHSFPIPLMSIFPDGGLVGCTDVIIVRVYPMAYLEKREGEKNVLRSERLERKIAALHQAEGQKKIDSICSKVQKEFEEDIAKQDCPPVSRRRSRRLNTLQIKQLHYGEEIYNALSNARDPQSFQEVLSHTQIILLESYRQSLVSKRQEELQSRIRDAVKEAEEQLPPQRNVVPLLRIRIVPSTTSDGLSRLRGDMSSVSDCHLSVWKPTDELRQLLKEGCSFRITNLTTYPSRFKHLQLTATRSSHYEPLKSQEPSLFYSLRVATPISQLHRVSVDQLAYREVDTVGIVVSTVSDHVMSHDPEGADRQVDSVFIADSEGCLMVVRLWDGLKSQGLEETVKPGSVLALSNMLYRGLGHTHNLPTCNAGDCTVFSQKPREQHLKDALADLNNNLPSRKDRLKFLQTLEDEISSYL